MVPGKVLLFFNVFWLQTSLNVAQKMPQSLLLQLEEYNRALQSATLEVLAKDVPDGMQSQPTYTDDGPEPFHMPSNFMHSFRPRTGVGNREDLVIDRIVDVPMFDDHSFMRWRYIRFNSSDYVLAMEKANVALWKKYINTSEAMDFSLDDAIFQHTVDGAGAVSDAVLFIRKIQSTDVLYVAIFISGESDVISIFEIVDNKGEMVAVVDLGFKTYPTEPLNILTYLESKHVGILAVLVGNIDHEGLVFRRKSSTKLNHYVEVHLQSAVDMVSFTVAGHGYLAVANRTVCVIYKMDDFVQSHIIFDRIYFEEEIVDLEHFRLGFQRYLVISSSNRQSMYIWKTGGFYKAQDFNSSNVNQAFSVRLPNCRDDVVLFLVKNGEFPDFFIWSGQQQKFIPVEIERAVEFLPLPNSMTSFSYGSSGYILYLDLYQTSKVVALETHLNPVSDPVLFIGKEVEEVMKQLHSTIKDQEDTLRAMSEVLDNAVKPIGDQSFTAVQAFRELRAMQETIADIPVGQNIFWEGSSITLAEYMAGTNTIEQKITELEVELDELERALEDVIRVDEDAVITGRKVFLGKAYGTSVHARSLNVEMVNGINLPELQKHIYRLDKPSTILGALTFEKPVTVTGNLEVSGTINGIDFSRDVLTANTHQRSNASMTFHNKLTVLGDLTLSGRVNGIDVGTEIVTLGGEHMITGKKTFSGGIFADTVSASVIDGVDMDRFFNKALTSSGNQTITGTKYFTGTLHTEDISLFGKINGYNVNDLVNSVVRTDVSTVITGYKTFHEDVIIQNSLEVGGTINGLTIPEDLFLLNRENHVTGSKSFTGTIAANDVFVSGTVNGLHLPDDVIVLSEDEHINATFHFHKGITVNGDVIVHGSVDGVDVSELARQTLKIEDLPSIKNAVFKGPVRVSGNLNVLGTVNDISLNHLANDILYKDEQNAIISAPKSFTKITAGSVKLHRGINGYDILSDFVTVSGDQTIYGTTVFEKPVIFEDVLVANGMVGGVNIEQLYRDRTSLSIVDLSDGDLEFVDSLIVNDLTVSGTIGGLYFPHDFVLRSSDQEISNKVFHGNVNVQHLQVIGDTFVSETFGGVRLQEFAEQRVTLSSDQEILGDLVLGNTSAVSVKIHDLINGLDINRYAENVMSLTKDQYVTASKDFSGKTTVKGHVTTSHGINGMNLADVDRRAFKLRGDITVEAPMVFNHPVTFTDLEVAGDVNGVNITHLNEDSLKKTGRQHIFGTTVFHQGFHVYGDITASTVNGLYLPRDVLTKNTEQTITGNYVLSSAVIQGNLELDGYVNGIDLSETAPLLSKANQTNVIYSDVEFLSPINVLGNVEVTGLVNGVDLVQLQQLVLKTSGDQKIPGHKFLRGNVTIHGDVNVDFVNGVHWASFLEDVVRIDIPQTITGKKYFLDDVEVEGDIYVSGTADVGRVNGVDLVEFQQNAVFIDRPANITGTKVFSNSVEVAGDLDVNLINNLRLKTDVVTLQCGDKEPQVISGEKTFEHLSVQGDIFVEGTVNGLKLYELEANTLTVDSSQTVTGEKIFREPVTFLKNIYPTTVNGLQLGRELITLDKDQEITGRLTFLHDVHVNEELQLSGQLNGIDLLTFANNVLYVDTDQEIDGSYTIEKATVNAPVLVDGTVNGLHFNKFAKTVSNFWAQKKGELSSLKINVEQQCEIVQHLHQRLEHSYYVLDGFSHHQTLNSSAHYINVDAFSREINLIKVNRIYLSVESARYQWLLPEARFELYSKEEETIVERKTYNFDRYVLSIQVGIKLEESKVTVNDVPLSISGGFSQADAVIHGNKGLIALLYYHRNMCEIYELTSSEEVTIEPSGTLQINGATSLAMFEMSGVVYLAVSCDLSPDYAQGSSKIYARIHQKWQLVQSILAPASRRVIHFNYGGHHYLAFGNAVPVYESREPQAIQIYRNSERSDGKVFILFQKLPFDNTQIMEVFEFGGLPELYLIAGNRTRTQVFLLEGEAGFGANYTIPGSCVSAVKPLVLDTELYLILGQNDQECRPELPSVVYKGLTKGSMVLPKTLPPC